MTDQQKQAAVKQVVELYGQLQAKQINNTQFAEKIGTIIGKTGLDRNWLITKAQHIFHAEAQADKKQEGVDKAVFAPAPAPPQARIAYREPFEEYKIIRADAEGNLDLDIDALPHEHYLLMAVPPNVKVASQPAAGIAGGALRKICNIIAEGYVVAQRLPDSPFPITDELTAHAAPPVGPQTAEDQVAAALAEPLKGLDSEDVEDRTDAAARGEIGPRKTEAPPAKKKTARKTSKKKVPLGTKIKD